MTRISSETPRAKKMISMMVKAPNSFHIQIVSTMSAKAEKPKMMLSTLMRKNRKGLPGSILLLMDSIVILIWVI